MKKHPLPKCGVIGTDGNTIAILSKVSSWLKKSGLRTESIEIQRTMLLGDYDFALQAMMRYVDPVHFADEVSGHLKVKNAAFHGHDLLHSSISSEKTEQLLKEGYSPNDENCYGRTPLFYVSSPEQARFLLNAGADPDKTDDFGMTPLFMSADDSVIEVLLSASKKKDLYSESEFGERPKSKTIFMLNKESREVGKSRANSPVKMLELMRSAGLLGATDLEVAGAVHVLSTRSSSLSKEESVYALTTILDFEWTGSKDVLAKSFGHDILAEAESLSLKKKTELGNSAPRSVRII